MNQSTADKFAAILKAAQEKAAAKIATKATTAPTQAARPQDKPTPPQAAKLPVNTDPNNTRTFDNIQDITNAANSGEVISILNLYNIVNNKPTAPTPPPVKSEVKEIYQDTTPESEKSKLKSFLIIWHEGPELNLENTEFKTWKQANEAMTAIYNTHEGQGYTKVKICIKWENGKEIVDRADCSDSAGDFCATRETIAEYLKRQHGAMYESNLQSGERNSMLSFTDENTTPETRPEISNFTFEDILNETTPQEEPAQEEQNSPASPANLAPCVMQWTKAGQATTAPVIIAATTPDKLAGFKTLKIGKFTFVEYSEKSFALLGDTKEDTKSIKDQLYLIGGKFNYYLKCGEGFIFSNRKYYTVKTFIEKL